MAPPTASGRSRLIRLAASLPKGGVDRRILLAAVSDALAEGFSVGGLTETQLQEIEQSKNRKWDPVRDADLIQRALNGDISEAERKALLMSPYYFDVARPGQRVAVHLNLGYKKKFYNLKSFSVKEKTDLSGRTVAHVPSTVISDATFRVNPAGQRMAEDDGNKTVHAGVIGRFGGLGGGRKAGVQLRYNPHKGMTWFMRQNPETGAWDIPVESARRVNLTPTGGVGEVWAEGVVDMPEAEAAKHRRARQEVRHALVRLASSLPKNTPERRIFLSWLKEAASVGSAKWDQMLADLEAGKGGQWDFDGYGYRPFYEWLKTQEGVRPWSVGSVFSKGEQGNVKLSNGLHVEVIQGNFMGPFTQIKADRRAGRATTPYLGD